MVSSLVQLIREQLKKMTAGGQPGNNAQGAAGESNNDQIGDSTDEDDGEVSSQLHLHGCL